jgi:hypothetical protein
MSVNFFEHEVAAAQSFLDALKIVAYVLDEEVLASSDAKQQHN